MFFGCEACGILAPQPGIEPAPPALEGGLNHWTAREVPDFLCVFNIFECNHSARESNMLENTRTSLWKSLPLSDEE